MDSHWTAAKTLWLRAPWWRFTVLSSLLLVLVVVLFRPRLDGDQRLPVLDSASYRPPAGSSSSTPSNLSAGTSPAAVPVASPQTPAASPSAPAVRTASLGLSHPGLSDAGPSGIDPALLGRTYHGKLQVSGFELPLPPGEWAMLASSTAHLTKQPETAGMQYFVGRIEHARLTGAINIIALRSPDRSGFEKAGTCASPQTIYTQVENITEYAHQACWTMHLVFTSGMQQWADKAAKMNTIYRMAGGDLSAKGVTYPQEMIAVHFVRSETWGALEAIYHFSPDTEHIRSNTVPTIQDSDWFGDNLRKYPEKVAYTERLRQWGDTYWPLFKAAFEAGAPAEVPAERLPVATARAALPAADADAVAPDQPLGILRVRYTSPRTGREIDVTDQFRSNCVSGAADCKVRCDNQLGSDPDFGTQKLCVIRYQCASRPSQELRIQEGKLATLSCPSVAAGRTAEARRCAIEKFGEWRRSQGSPPGSEAINSEIKEVNAQCGASLEFSVGSVATRP